MEIENTAQKQSALFRRIAATLGISFLLCAWLVATQEWIRQWDTRSMAWMQQIIGTWADIPLSLLSLPGSSEATALILFSVFFWILKKKKKKFYPVTFIALVLLLEIAGKLLISHPSPPKETLRYVSLFTLPASSYFQLYNSFPSGHVARGAFTGLILFFLIFHSRVDRIWKRIGSCLIAVYLLVMCISRISLGIHWLSDVTGGLLLGAAVAVLALSFWKDQELCSR